MNIFKIISISISSLMFISNGFSEEAPIQKISQRVDAEIQVKANGKVYKIIFKDYPLIRNPNLWKQVLNDLNASNISYIYDEKKLNTLLSTSDLIILPYMSTTFFDSLNSDADIFVAEEDIFEKPFKELLKNEIFYFLIS